MICPQIRLPGYVTSIIDIVQPCNIADVDDSQASEAAECIRYLASLGNQACVATVSGQSFCRRGQTQITGISLLDRGRTTSSTW
jgi:hypothetical protein